VKERYENIGGVRNRGFEISLKSDRQREITLDLAYSYIQAKFTRYNNFYQTLGSPYVPNPTLVRFDNTGKSVPRVPRHSLNSTLGWQADDKLRLALEMDAKTESWADEINQEKLPGRTLFHLSANYASATKGRWAPNGRPCRQPVRPPVLEYRARYQRHGQLPDRPRQRLRATSPSWGRQAARVDCRRDMTLRGEKMLE
jgi:hypothetical protein